MTMSSGLCSFGALLKSFRKRRHLTQQQLAEAVGVHRNAIGRWEQGDFLPASNTMVLELARHLHLDDQETRTLLEASLTALSPHWSVPLPRNPFFTGREEILEALHTNLSTDQVVALTQSYALHGLGGIGKTQIALEYAYRHALEYSAVFWIAAETGEQIVASLLRIAEVLQLPEREGSDLQHVVAAVQSWLSTRGRWLLIWDNVEDLTLLDRFLPATRSGVVLLTTRCQALGTLARGLDLLPMEQEEGILLLLRRAKVVEAEATSEQMQQFAERMPAHYAAAADLVTELGGLPLALDQAGAYLEETHGGLLAYLNLFRTRRSALLQRRSEGQRDHPASVAATFTLAVEATAEHHPAVRDLLQVCALFQPDAIPEEVFRQGGQHLGPPLQAVCGDPLEWDQVVGIACSSSLLSRQPEEQTLSLHRLVQAVLLDAMPDEQRERWSTRAIAALDMTFPDGWRVPKYATWKQCERLLPHALLLVQRVRATSSSLPLASLAYKMACYLLRCGRHAEAEAFFLCALQIREQMLGPEHPEVAIPLNKLAILFLQQGKDAEAERLLQRALQILGQTVEAEHREVASSLNALGVLSFYQGKDAQAEALYLRALQIQEQALGPEHPEVAVPLNNLAELYWEQGKYVEAERLLQRALQILELGLGLEYPGLAEPLSLLANLFREQGKFTQAEALYLRALQIQEQALGPEHPKGSASLNRLADGNRMQHRNAQAEPPAPRVLQTWEQSRDPEHLSVADPLHSLAHHSRDRSYSPEAEQFSRRALTLREQHLGQHHPLTAQTLQDLALLRKAQGRLSEALALAGRALHIRAQALGEAHPKTVATQALYEQILREQLDSTEPTIEHIRTILKARGWSVHLKKQRSKFYVYATRKVGGHTQSRYLAPLNNLAACLAAARVLPNAREGGKANGCPTERD